MAFNDPAFLFLFLPPSLLVYFATPRRFRNLMLLILSLAFYWSVNGPHVYALLGVSAIAYVNGILLQKTRIPRVRKLLVFIAILATLTVLIYYKYLGFFVQSVAPMFGLTITSYTQVVLPVGISFFVFQAISYVVDCYRGQVDAERNPVNFFVYTCMYPHLIAGPIVRYQDVASYIKDRRESLDQVIDGIKRFVFGLAKKVIIADELSRTVDYVFNLPDQQLAGSMVWVAAICYMFQIYFDFSGYSDMAIGLGRILGFRFLENFDRPYISKSITDFWRRWHISLSTWFRDYVYIPLGGNRVSSLRTYFNLIIIFALCGLWHGSNWIFLIWGLYHGFFLVLERVFLGATLKRLSPLLRQVYTLLVVLIGWIIFRSKSLAQLQTMLLLMLPIKANSMSIGYDFFDIFDLKSRIVLFFAFTSLVPYPVARLWAEVSDRFNLNSQRLILVARFGKDLLYFALFLLSVMQVAARSFTPFIYFQF